MPSPPAANLLDRWMTSTGVTLDGNGRVSSVANQVGGRAAAAQAATGQRPLSLTLDNGYLAARFSRDRGDLLTIAGQSYNLSSSTLYAIGHYEARSLCVPIAFGSASGLFDNNGGFRTVEGSQTGTGQDGLAGNQVLAAVYGAAPRLYANGTSAPIAWATGTQSGLTLGGWSSSNLTAPASWYEWLIYGEAHTPAQVDQVMAYAESAYPTRRRGRTLLICEGDSLTEGVAGNDRGYVWPTRLSRRRADVLVANEGLSGDSLQSMLAAADSTARPRIDANAGMAVGAILYGGTNDLSGGRTPAQAYGDLVQLALAYRAMGCQWVIAVTMLPRNSIADATRQTYCDLIVGNADRAFTRVVDVRRDALIGAAGAEASGTWYLDGIHLTDAGHGRLADLIEPELDIAIVGRPTAVDVAAAVRTNLAPELACLDENVSAAKTLKPAQAFNNTGQTTKQAATVATGDLADITAARAAKIDNVDATISSRSTYAGGAVASVTGNVGGNVVGSVGSVTAGVSVTSIDAATLLAIANKVEAEIIDETDNEKVLAAITNKIASVNPSLGGLTVAAIAAASRDATLNAVVAGNFDVVGSLGKLAQYLDASIAARPTNPLLANDARLPTSGVIAKVTDLPPAPNNAAIAAAAATAVGNLSNWATLYTADQGEEDAQQLAGLMGDAIAAINTRASQTALNAVAASVSTVGGNVTTLIERLTAERAAALDHLDADVSDVLAEAEAATQAAMDAEATASEVLDVVNAIEPGGEASPLLQEILDRLQNDPPTASGRQQYRDRKIVRGDAYGPAARPFRVVKHRSAEWPLDLGEWVWAFAARKDADNAESGTTFTGTVVVEVATGESRAFAVTINSDTAAAAIGRHVYSVRGTRGGKAWSTELGVIDVVDSPAVG